MRYLIAAYVISLGLVFGQAAWLWIRAAQRSAWDEQVPEE